jgi:hypothetical protein
MAGPQGREPLPEVAGTARPALWRIGASGAAVS